MRTVQYWFQRLTSLSPRFAKQWQFLAIGAGVFLFGSFMLSLMVDGYHVPETRAFAGKLFFDLVATLALCYQVIWKDHPLTTWTIVKFLVGRGVTLVASYYLFCWLIQWQFRLPTPSGTLSLGINYILANVACVALMTAVNYVVSDQWVFNSATARSDWYYRSRNLVVVLTTLLGLYLLGGLHNLTASVLACIATLTFVMATFDSIRALYSHREPEAIDRMKFPELQAPQERIALLVAAVKEQAVIYDTLAGLVRQSHPDYMIVVVLCDVDPEDTMGEALRAHQEFPDRITVLEYQLPAGVEPCKALQLNHGLDFLRGRGITVVGVIDAEDDVASGLLTHIDTVFRDPEVDVVQSSVQLMNFDGKWFTVQNCMEYASWYMNVMPFQSEVANFVPLGGNTVFVRYGLLVEAGGWPVTLTEDCSLGVKLSVEYGAKVAAFSEPCLATREETPDSLVALFRQRVRWYQGFYAELRKGLWRQLPAVRQRLMALYVLCSPMYQAFSSVMVPVTLATMFALKAPVPLVMMMYAPLVPMVLQWALRGVTLYDFGRAFDRKIKLRYYASLMLLQPVYQMVLNLAGMVAIFRELRGIRTWYRPAHTGQHRTAVPVPGLAPVLEEAV